MSHADEIRAFLQDRDSAVPRARSLAAIASPPPDNAVPVWNDETRQWDRHTMTPVGVFVTRNIDPPRSPLEDAANDLQMAVAYFYVLIARAETSDDITRIWRVVQQMEQLVMACNSAAGRKADAL
jgi:hypothetical protein